MKLPATILLVLLCSAVSATPQDITGRIDLKQSIEEQIELLEKRVFGDLEQQSVVLRWLIELYVAVERYDDAEAAYQQIIIYLPWDFGTVNSYAEFLMDEREDLAAADSLLEAAERGSRRWAPQSVHRSRTFELWAELALRQDLPEVAAYRARRAVALLDDEAQGGAQRILARAYRRLERFDDAADAYLKVIAIEGGTNREDINALQTIVAKTTRFGSGSTRDLIEEVVAGENARRRARVNATGADLVTIATDDGVRLEGTLRRTPGPGAVLFVPDVASRRSTVEPYAQLLSLESLTTMSVDLRGQGNSRTDSLPSFASLSPAQRSRLSDDVVAAYRYLRGLVGEGDDRIAIVAEGGACAVVEKSLRRGRLRPAVVYLSPEFDGGDRELLNAMAFHPDREILVAMSREDPTAMRSAQLLRDAREHRSMEEWLLRNAGHGVEMLKRDPALFELVQGWTKLAVGAR